MYNYVWNGGVIIKEYSIYQKHGKGKPYILHTYNNIDSAKFKLYNIIKTEEERGRRYFVDNDFFNNKYTLVGDLYYLKIIVRDVTDWKDYSEQEYINKNDKKIIFMQNVKNY